MPADERYILHLSDWNYNDKFYNAPLSLIKELSARIKKDGMSEAWQWWTDLVDYDGDGTDEEPIHMNVPANHDDSDEFFLDYEHPLECLAEWDEEWAGE